MSTRVKIHHIIFFPGLALVVIGALVGIISGISGSIAAATDWLLIAGLALIAFSFFFYNKKDYEADDGGAQSPRIASQPLSHEGGFLPQKTLDCSRVVQNHRDSLIRLREIDISCNNHQETSYPRHQIPPRAHCPGKKSKKQNYQPKYNKKPPNHIHLNYSKIGGPI